MPSRAPITLRMSRAPARWARPPDATSTESSAGWSTGRCWDWSDMAASSEGDVQGDGHHEGDGREREGAAVPREPRLVRVDQVLPGRLAVDEALEGALGLRLGHQRDHDAQAHVDDERDR